MPFMKTTVFLIILISFVSCSNGQETNNPIEDYYLKNSSDTLKSISHGKVSDGSIEHSKLVPYFGKNYSYFDTTSYFSGRAFLHEGSLSAWIKTIVVNTTLSHNRNNKKHHYTEDIDDVQVRAETVPLFDDEMDISRRKQEAIMKSLQELPVGYRTVFNLYVVEGYTHKEIAEIMDISENTSKSQLSKARKYLKKLLGIEEKVNHGN